MPFKNNFMKSGDKITLASEDSVKMFPMLAAGTYSVNFHLEIGFYLKEIENIIVEGKIYGDVEKRTKRILNTFNDRPSTTGVLLKGEKGSGKTLLAKMVCHVARETMGVPTLVVNSAFSGENFNNFIAGINQPCIIMFDEFEKVYSSGQLGGKSPQQELLTLFDGLYKTKKLFLVTCNDYSRIDNAMRNRPGRFFYAYNYKGLEEDFVREYCTDRLNNKSHVESVVLFSKQFNNFNFDMLKAIVEEMNRYEETVVEVVKHLNAETSGEHFRYKIKSFVRKDGKEPLKLDEIANNNSPSNIFDPRMNIWVGYILEEDLGKRQGEDGEDYKTYTYFYNNHLTNINDSGEVVFENEEGTLVVERIMNRKKKEFDGMSFIAAIPAMSSSDENF